MESTLKRTWAEIDLDALSYNYRVLRDHVGADVKFLGVVKADAYGHGAVQVSRTLQELGADYLAVSSIDEAAELVGKYEIVPAAVAQKAIPACNITFIAGDEMKQALSGYLSVLFEQNPKAVGGAMPGDDFYYAEQ